MFIFLSIVSGGGGGGHGGGGWNGGGGHGGTLKQLKNWIKDPHEIHRKIYKL